MRRLAGLAIGLSLGLALAMGLAQQIGRRQPAPTWMSTLHLRDCALPCWIHIVPGQTSGHRTFVTIDTVFLTTLEQTLAPMLERQTGRGGIRVPLPDQDHPRAYVGLDFSVFDNTLYSLSFRFDPTDDALRDYVPRLGDLAAWLGLPACVVTPSRAVAGWMLLYDTADGVIVAGLYQDVPLDWTSPIYVLSMRQSDPGGSCQPAFVWAGLSGPRYLR